MFLIPQEVLLNYFKVYLVLVTKCLKIFLEQIFMIYLNIYGVGNCLLFNSMDNHNLAKKPLLGMTFNIIIIIIIILAA